MVEKFETTGIIDAQSVLGRKGVKQDQVEEVATAVMHQAIVNKQGTSNILSISEQTTLIHKLLPGDRNFEFALRILA